MPFAGIELMISAWLRITRRPAGRALAWLVHEDTINSECQNTYPAFEIEHGDPWHRAVSSTGHAMHQSHRKDGEAEVVDDAPGPRTDMTSHIEAECHQRHEIEADLPHPDPEWPVVCAVERDENLCQRIAAVLIAQ